MNTPNSAPRIAGSNSASANRIAGDLPPSSSVTRLSVRAAAAMTSRPAADASGERHLVHAGMRDERRARRLAAAGDDVDYAWRKACRLERVASSSADSGVSSAGFSTTVHPAQTAGASFHAAITSG